MPIQDIAHLQEHGALSDAQGILRRDVRESAVLRTGELLVVEPRHQTYVVEFVDVESHHVRVLYDYLGKFVVVGVVDELTYVMEDCGR